MTLKRAESITGLELQRVAQHTFAALDRDTGRVETVQFDRRGDPFAVKAIVECIWEKRKLACLDRDGWKCVLCGRRDQLTVDHIVKRSKGRSDDLSNLRTLCCDCHQQEDNGLRIRRV